MNEDDGKIGSQKPSSITRNYSTSGRTLTLGMAEVEDAKKRLSGLKKKWPQLVTSKT